MELGLQVKGQAREEARDEAEVKAAGEALVWDPAAAVSARIAAMGSLISRVCLAMI
jgi:hypothetical protein